MTARTRTVQAQTGQRVVFDTSDETVEAIDSMGREIGEPTRAGVLRRAVRLLAFVIEIQRKKGRLVARFPNGTERDIEMLM